MSLFFTYYGEVGVATGDLQKLIAAAVGGTVSSHDTIFCPGMNVTAHRVDDDDEDSTGRYFGFVERVTATFNFDSQVPDDVSEHNTALMVRAVLALFDAYPGRGVLLFNGERVVLQRLSDGVEFDAEWEDWAELDEVRPLLAAHQQRKLPQPLM
jgi:hypothetical protein